MSVTERVIEGLPHQIEFLVSEARELLFSGAFRAGKSISLCLKLVERASRSGAREALCRKHLVTLKATTLRTLLEGDGEFEPVLPPGTYEHNKSEKTIKLHGGGEIVYFGLDDPTKIGSYTLSGVAVDEAEELTEDDWTALRGRLNLSIPGMVQQLYAACNPSSPSHFLAKRFGLGAGYQCQPNCRAIRTQTADNPYLSAEYMADLNSFTGVAKKRFVLGQWAGSDRLVYDIWDRQVHVQTREGPWRRVVCGMDEGYTNPGVLLVIGEDGDGRKHVISECYERRVLSAEWTRRAKAAWQQWSAVQIAVDPAAAGFIAELNAAGLPAIPAENDRRDGVRLVKACLAIPSDGHPRLTVDPSCLNVIREFETWENKPDDHGKGDDYTKENDHAMDALRYAVEFLGEYHEPPEDRSDYLHAVQVVGAHRRPADVYANGTDPWTPETDEHHQDETV